MKIEVRSIRAVHGGADAAITVVLSNGEDTQEIKGTVSAQMLGDLGFAGKLDKSFEIDRETCDTLLYQMKLYAAVNRGLYLLGFAACTKKMMVRKLVQKGFPKEISEEAATYLQDHHHIVERTDAEILIENLAKRKFYGKNRIKQELFKKGFSEDVIRDSMENCDIDFTEILEKRILKTGILPDLQDRETRQKTVAALVRYGFTYDNIKNAMQDLT